MNGAVRKTALIAAIVCATAVIGAGPAGAGGGSLPRTVHVRGTQQAVNGSIDFFTMRSYAGRAGLVGDWAVTDRFSRDFRSPFYFETGAERFDGCLDRKGDNACHGDPTGSMTFDYALWIKFDPALLPDVFKELAGGCVHPITGGSGAFAGARGLLTMRDRPVGDEIETTYRGSLTLGPGASGSAAGIPAAPAVTAPANAQIAPTSEAAGPPAPVAQHQGC